MLDRLGYFSHIRFFLPILSIVKLFVKSIGQIDFTQPRTIEYVTGFRVDERYARYASRIVAPQVKVDIALLLPFFSTF